jgi:peptide/nickel transport system ATP-binding protein
MMIENEKQSRHAGALVSVENLQIFFTVRKGLFGQTVVRAVDRVSLEIGRGETFAVVGESGSGKTTLGRGLLRLIETAGGEVVFDGKKLSGFGRHEIKEFRRRAQIVFQDPYSSISPYMPVREIVAEPLVIHGIRNGSVRDNRVREALDQVNLTPAEEIMEKFPHNLSGGQRQRVSIARAMILDPEFVVADEPVSMVDASNRSEILYLLRALQEQRSIAFLYITHDIANARHFSDRIAVMYLGTIVESGASDVVVTAPLHPYTKGLLAAVPEPDPENRKRLRPVIAGEPPSAARVPPGCPFHPRCPSFISGTCEVERPALATHDTDHQVACWLYR